MLTGPSLKYEKKCLKYLVQNAIKVALHSAPNNKRLQLPKETFRTKMVECIKNTARNFRKQNKGIFEFKFDIPEDESYHSNLRRFFRWGIEFEREELGRYAVGGKPKLSTEVTCLIRPSKEWKLSKNKTRRELNGLTHW